MSTAGNERGLSLRSPGRFLAPADRLRRALAARRRTAPTPRSRDRVADAWIGARAYRLHTWATVDPARRRAATLGAEASLGKVFWSELDVALHETALDLLGRASGELAGRAWLDGYLFSLAGPIYAGHQRDPAQHRRRAAAGPAEGGTVVRLCPGRRGRDGLEGVLAGEPGALRGVPDVKRRPW